MLYGTRRPWHPRRFPDNGESTKTLHEWLVNDSTLVLNGFDLTGADLSGGNFVESYFFESTLREIYAVGADFSRCCLDGADLSGSDLTATRYFKTELNNAFLFSARLDRASLTRAELCDTDARNASFRCASFIGAMLLEADFRGADLTSATLDRAFFEVKIDNTTTVEGLHGSAFGPATIINGDTSVKLNFQNLERWLTDRGANVKILTPHAPLSTENNQKG